MKSYQWTLLMLIVAALIASDMVMLHREQMRRDAELSRIKDSIRDLQRLNLVESLDDMSNEQLTQVYLKNKGDIDAIWVTMPEHSRLKDAIAEMIHRDNVAFEEQGGCMGTCLDE